MLNYIFLSFIYFQNKNKSLAYMVWAGCYKAVFERFPTRAFINIQVTYVRITEREEAPCLQGLIWVYICSYLTMS